MVPMPNFFFDVDMPSNPLICLIYIDISYFTLIPHLLPEALICIRKYYDKAKASTFDQMLAFIHLLLFNRNPDFAVIVRILDAVWIVAGVVVTFDVDAGSDVVGIVGRKPF